MRDSQEPNALTSETTVATSGAATMVAEDPDAIGRLGFSHFGLGTKVIAMDGVMPAEKTAQAVLHSVVRAPLFLMVPLTQPLAYDLIEFALGKQGQASVVNDGWVPTMRRG